MKLSMSCKLIVILIVVIVLPFKTIQANITNTYTFWKGVNTSGQTSPLLDFSVNVITAGLLEMQYNVRGHCSDLRLHILIDNSPVFTTDWLGYQGRVPALPLDTGLLNLGPVTSGQHTLTLSPEGRVSGCNIGVLRSWAGTLEVTTSEIPAPTAITIDIKPGSDPNPINQGSNGLVPVAIFSRPEFDATQVDPTSVSLAGATVAVRGKGKSMAHEEDVNGDGLVDLVVQVETQGFDDLGSGGIVQLTGTTFGGEAIVGYDVVVIVPPDQ